MVRGGKQILNYLLILTFLMISSLSFAQTNEPLYIQYTAPIGMQTLNPNIKSNKNYYNSTSYGASHSILNEIFKNTNVKTKYTPYSNYNEALQTSMLYLSNNTPDIIIGITFDENNLEYLDYISQPIYTDNIVLVIDKSSIPNNNTISKDLFETISQLSQTNNAIELEGFTIPNLQLSSIKIANINSAMETIFNNKSFLISTMEFVNDYLNDNKNNPKIKSLKIIKYPNKVNYFMALNKKKTFEKITSDKEIYPFKNFIEIKLDELLKSNKINEIITEFKTK